ncbi:uncharacterized protein LOC110069505 isoform X2 [Orbicella faveolata]|uniref:uncharacterized protein LOC110069505 isoform X2 n=1 Tax=Orbicella faveolata TaxID=48498 RepID=UPI0009E45285|nr:uncharacterized protein LOC110069505 isoform X2 [Orbicella faveolata]
MATWIKQPWIENALKSCANSLPKIARAQVLKLEETSAVISDKKLFVKAEFSPAAIEEFKRDNTSLQLNDILGGLIFIKKYSVRATEENELDHAEFLISIEEFKFAGGEGNTQFGSDVTDSSACPQFKARLQQLWRAGQLRKQLVGGEANVPDGKEAESLMLHNHNQIFIPDDMERKLAEIPGE